ncbi:MAG: hypothetical protein V4538_16300 [Bacteroidota bacterium]
MQEQTHARRIRIPLYPNRLHYKLTTAYAFNTSQSKPEAWLEINKKFFEAMDPKEKEKLLRLYDTMTDKEKQNPKKI